MTSTSTSSALDMPVMPENVSPYKKTPVFDETTVPKGLLKEHQTKAGVWGMLRVTSGQLEYHITELGFEANHLLTPENPGIIVPEQRHHISAATAVEFSIEFCHHSE